MKVAPRVNNDAIRLPPRGRLAVGRASSHRIRDGMEIDFSADPLRPGDAISVWNPAGEKFDLFFGSAKADGRVSVWYAVHPIHRHWLGWLEPAGGNRWIFRMEPFHRDWLAELQADFPEVFGEPERNAKL